MGKVKAIAALAAALALMEQAGCLQLAEGLESSPIEYFANAYIEHTGSSYVYEDWGDYSVVG